MRKLNEIYKCNLCGNIIEVVHASGGQLVCCNENMNLLVENTVDASKEKHVPVVEKTENGILVKVGSVAHPMTDEHKIEFIEVIADGKVLRKFLKSGSAPEAKFCCVDKENIIVREYCNLHGLWKA